MPVEIITSGTGASGSAAFLSQFSDSFGTNGVLDNTAWFLVCKPLFTPNVSPAWTTRATIANTTFDASPGLVWSLCWDGATSANTNWRGLCIPIKKGFYTSMITAKQQFSQIKILKATLNFGQSAGPSIALDPTNITGFTAYEVDLQTDGGGNWRLQRANNDSFTVVASGTGVVAGDTWRLAGDYTSASQTVLTLSQNGTVVTTFTDTTGSRLSSGGVCICSLVAATSGALEMRSYSGGTGL